MTIARTPAYHQQRWSLAELLPDAAEETVAARLAAAEAEVAAFESRRELLTADVAPATLLDLLRRYEALTETLVTLGAYGALWFAEDTRSPQALAFKSRVEHALTGFANRLLFFSLWWRGLDDDAAARLLPAAGEHPDYRHYLLDERRLKPFTLDETSERIINSKDADGIGALVTMYSLLTNRLEFTLELDGEVKTLTRGELMSHVYSADPELRAAAYRELYRVYDNDATLLAQIYLHRVRDWASERLELRGYASPIAVRHEANDIPGAAVDALLAVVTENVGLFQRYFRLKARWLGMDRLSRYDLYAPLAGSVKEIPYGRAVEMVLATFRGFDRRFGELAERVFADDHVDAEIRRGKKGGAFCSTVLPRHTPWVLLNYTARVRDVATMAHELGHAVHSLLAAGHSVLTQHACLPLAETASVFAEQLLTDRLLAEERDPAVRRELLAAQMDDIYATVMRQAYFTRFEIAAHRAIAEDAAVEALDEIYFATLREQFGDTVALSDDFRREWVTIPHIYQSPFYCYAYSFGQLLVLALYRRYQEEGDAFVPGYLEMLAAGGSAPPVEVLAAAGVDPTDPAFWRGGFDVVRGIVDELEAL
ncbi:MAG: M3 family oligoendopeptidase [Acidobacteriota bacterium]|nr:M3 family oligoendopeptidase [Acidobacteriota bacterium]MDH3522736.1 M3 family oligoendopeptidase [Acidobacteriota bacterium]